MLTMMSTAVATKMSKSQLKPCPTSANAVPAAGGCSVSVAAIRNMDVLTPTAA